MQGDVVRVVGVTRDPDEIEESASLLLLTLRLILDAETEHDARSTRDALARELLAEIVAGRLDAEGLGTRSAAAGGAMDAPFRVVVAFEQATGDRSNSRHAVPPAATARIFRAAGAERERVASADFDSGHLPGERMLAITCSGPPRCDRPRP